MTNWIHTHADWWQSAGGEAIHAIEIEDDGPVQIFYGYAAGSVRHCCEAGSLDEVRQQIEQMREAA